MARTSKPTANGGPESAKALTVSQLNRLARETLEDGFGRIAVEGEISELLQHRSGHWYFTLKDEQAQLRVAMFRSANARVRFQPENGQQVVLRGQLSIYEARGSYQLIASSMQPAGEGRLLQQFEKLKQSLAGEGLFSSEIKSPLPDWPQQIALLTSPQGAALRDMLSTFRRRHAGVELVVVPVAVQGSDAAATIAAAIDRVNRLAKQEGGLFSPDAMIVGRGGGSLEDLWAFNEEVVARAIHRSAIPIVSAVGHETDFTIADFVADARAATPTAAAELLSPDTDALQEQLGGWLRRLASALRKELAEWRWQLSDVAGRLQHPASRLREHALTLDHLDNRLVQAANAALVNRQQQLAGNLYRLRANSPDRRIAQLGERLQRSAQQLQQQTGQQLRDRQARLQTAATGLDIVSPLATLRRGYAIALDEQQKIIRSVAGMKAGDKLEVKVADGSLRGRVETVMPTDD